MVKVEYNFFSDDEIQTFAAPMKIGILATASPEGLPHLSLISTLQACGPNGLVFGQFTEGLSKQYIRQNPKVGFLIMSLDKEVWRGKATFTHTASSGPEYDLYNNIPMFRYNAYFGIHTVYYMDLMSHSGRHALDMPLIVRAALETRLARLLPRRAARPVLNEWTHSFLNKLDNLKFLAYIGIDGYPVVVPVIQAQAAGTNRVIFSTSAYRQDLEAMPVRAGLALFGMSLKMQDVLVRGTFRGIRRFGLAHCGVLDIDWVYNSMPPKPQQIYPEAALEAVTQEW